MLLVFQGYVFKGEQCYKIVSGRKDMNKYPLIGGSICAVVLLVLASLTNVVGYQTVQASNQKMINTEINEKELLFQTIVNMANNKEIQKVIYGSEITEKGFINHGMRFPIYTSSVLIKRQLNFMLFFGRFLSKTMGMLKSFSHMRERQIVTPKIQQRIKNIIEKDTKLNKEITQLSDLSCHCYGENDYPGMHVICAFIFLLMFSGAIVPNLAIIMILVAGILATLFQCPWIQIPDNPLHL